jgi:sulfur carrier protein
MTIILNNREEQFEAEILSVSKMLELKKFSFKMRLIKINDMLIARDKYDSTFIHDGDRVQMLYLMSGG